MSVALKWISYQIWTLKVLKLPQINFDHLERVNFIHCKWTMYFSPWALLSLKPASRFKGNWGFNQWLENGLLGPTIGLVNSGGGIRIISDFRDTSTDFPEISIFIVASSGMKFFFANRTRWKVNSVSLKIVNQHLLLGFSCINYWFVNQLFWWNKEFNSEAKRNLKFSTKMSPAWLQPLW